MPETESVTKDPQASKPITVKQEWVVTAILAILVISIEVLGYFVNPVAYRQKKTTSPLILGGLAWWFAHALWLTMDRRRRGLEVGRWRYGAIFFGPLAIWVYLLLEYRLRALYLIPLSLAVYLGTAMIYLGVMNIAGRMG